jgi:hypothetical protein
MKTLIAILAVTLLVLASPVVGQKAPAHTAPAKKPAIGGPTKVTGAPTKTASGLEYWDIRIGTGAVA